ncbi:hypothetical protein DFJ73DRAFT_151725 [Zopfochytrium polystomum]|nr:hypothetical protein DFJ73DRAFT_151725 [Zopfochytrium polystomum]
MVIPGNPPAGASEALLHPQGKVRSGAGVYYAEVASDPYPPTKKDSKGPSFFQRNRLWLIALAVLVLVIVAVAIVLSITVLKPKNAGTNQTSTSGAAVDFTKPFALQFQDKTVCVDVGKPGRLGLCPTTAAEATTNGFVRSEATHYWSVLSNSSLCLAEGALGFTTDGVSVIDVSLTPCFQQGATIVATAMLTYNNSAVVSAASNTCLTLLAQTTGSFMRLSACRFPVPLNQTWIPYTLA